MVLLHHRADLPQAPNCTAGEELHVRVDFADCWDGVHLDSPDG